MSEAKDVPEVPQPTKWPSGGTSRPLVERFWEKVQKGDGCWLWRGGPYTRRDNRPRYGRIGTGPNRQTEAHRVSWELHNGPVRDGLHVCHTCDNPRCVRPDHLFLGTAGDNIHDAIRKGRLQVKGRLKTHCKRGHEMTAENTRPVKGGRMCMVCRRLSGYGRVPASRIGGAA